MSSCLLTHQQQQQQQQQPQAQAHAPKQLHRKRAVPDSDSRGPRLRDEANLNEDDDDNGDERSPLKNKQEPQKKQKVDYETAEELMHELREMPGMEKVVAQVEALLGVRKVNLFLLANGMSNLIITGVSDTGKKKTTVASKGRMIEVDKGTLKDKHIGGEMVSQTKKVLESATGPGGRSLILHRRRQTLACNSDGPSEGRFECNF